MKLLIKTKKRLILTTSSKLLRSREEEVSTYLQYARVEEKNNDTKLLMNLETSVKIYRYYSL